MTDKGKKYIIELLQEHDERQRRMRDRARNRDDFNDYDDFEDEADYYDELDGRRGSRGGNRSRRRSDMRSDMEDFHYDKPMKLTKSEGNRWLHEMENTDGTQGPHYSMQEVMHVAEKLGIRFNEFSEREFFITVNMWYSDFGHVTKRVVGDNKEKELMVNADYAKAYLEDPDGADGSKKLAVTFHCMRGD